MLRGIDPEEVLNQQHVLDRLAQIEHERWAHWQRYVHDNSQKQQDGSLVIPPELVERWARQISTPYDELTQKEKLSDQEQVRRYLPVVIEALG